MQEEDKKLDDRRIWLGYLTKYVKPGRIVEFGCGSGFVLETLSADFASSYIVGLDKSIERLEKVVEKGFKNVIPVKADITQNIFLTGKFDTALFVGVLHEIFSYYGKEKVVDALRIAHSVLKDDGVLIIQDFLRPSARPVEMGFKNEETRKKFFRFADEFRPRKVEFEETARGVKLDIADAIEFISKYRSPDEEDWKEEMSETHFSFTENDHQELAHRPGFVIENSIKLPKSENWRVETGKDIEFGFEHEYRWIQLVLVKK